MNPCPILAIPEKNVSGRDDKGAHVISGPTYWWRRLDLLNFFGVFFVVKAVPKEVSKITQGSLQSICDGLFSTLEG